MIKDIITNAVTSYDFHNIVVMIMWLMISYGMVLLAMAIDLVSGVQKAIKNGIATTSTGLKMTCDKANKYYSPMLRLSFIDLLASAFLSIPVFTMIWGAWCLFCEWKSVTEKAHTKKELREASETMSVILKNKDDVTEAIALAMLQALEKMKEESNENN